jgi:hypothetical protein
MPTERRPLLKRLEADEDIQDLNVPMSIEMSFATSAKISEMGILEQVIEKAVGDLEKRFAKEGFKLYVRTGLVHAMTQEELISILPRKVHMAEVRDGKALKQICETPHVSYKNLTTNETEVTCKRCLKLIEGALKHV